MHAPRRAAAWVAGCGALLAFTATVGVLAAGPPPSAARGEAIYARCAACHALTFNRVGPKHCGLFGRESGSVPGFDYSSAMKHAHIVWNARTLDRFLASPLKTVPGTAMTYDGVPDPGERADLIAYLQQAGRSAECKAAR